MMLSKGRYVKWGLIWGIVFQSRDHAAWGMDSGQPYPGCGDGACAQKEVRQELRRDAVRQVPSRDDEE